MSRTKQSGERHLEFGGAAGVSLLVFGLPAATMAINIACNKVLSPTYWHSRSIFVLLCIE